MSACVFLTCDDCKTQYCIRSCNYTCSCGKERNLDEEARKERAARVVFPEPEGGWW